MDPQTSGGLLFSIASDATPGFLGQLAAAGVPAVVVGHVVARDPGADLVHLV
jgi:hypothetical protein